MAQSWKEPKSVALMYTYGYSKWDSYLYQATLFWQQNWL